MPSPLTTDTDISEIVENFSFLDDWEDRYRYLIELGNSLTPLDEAELVDANKVRGCVSQVWLVSNEEGGLLHFRGTSDAHIVRGLVAVALAIFSGKTVGQVIDTDEQDTFKAIGLEEHLTPQRANGLRAMVARIKDTAASVQAGGS